MKSITEEVWPKPTFWPKRNKWLKSSEQLTETTGWTVIWGRKKEVGNALENSWPSVKHAGVISPISSRESVPNPMPYFQPAACFNPYPCSSAQGPVFAPSPLSRAAVRTRRSLGLTSPLLFSECLFIWLLPAQANKVNGYATVQTALGHKPKEKTKLKKKT